MRIPQQFAPLIDAISAQASFLGVHLYLTGGFVRDLMLGVSNTDIDIVVEGDAIALARSLVIHYGGRIAEHAPFGTAIWTPDETALEKIIDGREEGSDGWPSYIDFAGTRTETYVQPAALPTVTLGATITQDLHRRDFTINAMAIRILPPPSDTLIDPHGGRADLKDKIIRILHDRSFVDDPTRIFRAIRFAGRLDATIEPHSAELLKAGIPFVQRLSGRRVANELDKILLEDRPGPALALLDDLGLTATLDPDLRVDRTTLAALDHADTELAEKHWWTHTEADLLAVRWVIFACRVSDTRRLVERLALDHRLAAQLEQGHRAYRAILDFSLHRETPLKPSEIVAHLDGMTESVLLAAWALASTDVTKWYIVRYASKWQHVRPTVNGDKLRSMGLKPGPLFGKLLVHLRRAWLDGDITTPDQEQIYLEQLVNKESGHDGTPDRG